MAGASIACNGKLFLANFSVLCVDVPDARNCDNSIRLVRGVCWGVQGSQSPGWSVHLQPLSASIHHPLLATPFRLPPLAGLRRYSISIPLRCLGLSLHTLSLVPSGRPRLTLLHSSFFSFFCYHCLQACLLQLASFGSLLIRPFVKQINVTDYWCCSLVNMFHGKLAIGSKLATSLEE